MVTYQLQEHIKQNKKRNIYRTSITSRSTYMYNEEHSAVLIYSASQKKSPLAACGFLTFFHKQLKILNPFFTLLLYVSIYARLQIFIQLSPTSYSARSPSSHRLYAQNIQQRPKRTRSDVCKSR